MKIKKMVQGDYERGQIIEDGSNFHRLIIFNNPEDYNQGNWTEDNLVDLADTIYAFLREIKREKTI